MPRALLLLPALVIVGHGHLQKPDSIPADSVCTHTRGFVDPCVGVHGRVMTYSDNYTVGLWKIGTRRLLGIQNEIDRLDFPV